MLSAILCLRKLEFVSLRMTVKIAFEQKKQVYPDYVVKGIKRSISQADEGELKTYTGIRNMLKGQ